MKFAAALASVVSLASATQTCLYCKRMDTNAGFLYSYQYCESEDLCILDSWNLINLKETCTTTPIDGYTLDIDNNCLAGVAKCGSFISSESAKGTEQIKYDKFTIVGNNQKCTIEVDATAFPAHIRFIQSSNELGVLYPGYVLGQPIHVP